MDAFQGISIGQFRVSEGSGDAPQFLKREDVAQIVKPDPMPAAEGADTTFEVNLVSKKKVKEVPPKGSGRYVLFPGDYKLNEAVFPGKPKHFELNRSAQIRIQANGHPIHIHVNPLLLPNSEDEDHAKVRRKNGLPTMKYWTDTVYVDDPVGVTGTMPFENWTGRTVVHCHILDHEDSGMMNIFEIRNPSGAPIAPLPGVLDFTEIPESIRQLMKPVWPDQKPSLHQTEGSVVVFAFLPRTTTLGKCPHCALSVGSLSRLRDTISNSPDFRIVVVTGPNDTGILQLAAALNLDATKDMICVDPELKIFQALALIDGTPAYDKTVQRYTFPHAFDTNGVIIHDSDVMHGLFTVDPKGFVVSSRRAFMAEDDIEHLFADIRFAQNVTTTLKVDRGSPSPTPPTGMVNGSRAFDRLNLKRQVFRYQEFKDRRK